MTGRVDLFRCCLQTRQPPRFLRELLVWREQVMPFDSPALMRSLRAFDLSVACHERSLRFAEGKHKLSRMEAAGVELDRPIRNRPVSAFSLKTATAQHAYSAEHAFHSPKSAPAARGLRSSPVQRAMIRSNPETLSARDYAGAP